MEYRSIPNDHDGFRETTGYAFSPETGPPDLDETVSERHTVGDARGLFEEGAVRAVCKHYWFDARVRDAWLPMAGLGAVATPPAYRRRGNVRRVLEESLAEYRERDVPLSVLWPFDQEFYARMGWGLATRFAVHEGPPGELDFAREAVDGGEFVDLDPGDWDRMADVLRAYTEGHSLVIDRSEEWWRKRVFRAFDGEPYVYGWERDGELRAYLVYTVDDDGDRLHVYESAHVDHEARLAILAFLSNHDSQVDAVRTYAPDASLLDVLASPGEFETTLRAGAMARIADVREAFESLRVPDGVAGTLRLAIEDRLAAWNDGAFEVVFEDGEARIDRIEESAAVDLAIDVGALSQLYVAYRGIDDLVRTGDAEVDTERARDLLRVVFPPEETFLGERF